MYVIHCPYCGPRPELEFHYGGEAHLARPEDPETLSDEDWADFLFMRMNTKGQYRERWMHSAGCRRWFNAVRDTVTYKFLAFYKVGDAPPTIGNGEG